MLQLRPCHALPRQELLTSPDVEELVQSEVDFDSLEERESQDVRCRFWAF